MIDKEMSAIIDDHTQWKTAESPEKYDQTKWRPRPSACIRNECPRYVPRPWEWDKRARFCEECLELQQREWPQLFGGVA